jgi:hypothetical protein
MYVNSKIQQNQQNQQNQQSQTSQQNTMQPKTNDFPLLFESQTFSHNCDMDVFNKNQQLFFNNTRLRDGI